MDPDLGSSLDTLKKLEGEEREKVRNDLAVFLGGALCVISV